jgi:hypothetical protein
MRLFIDSSSLTKRYLEEKGSDKLARRLEMVTDLGISDIVVPEIISALQRRVRENSLSSNGYQTIKSFLLEDIRDATVLLLTPSVMAKSIKLLENNVLRAMDSLHIASALEWNAEVFLTLETARRLPRSIQD